MFDVRKFSCTKIPTFIVVCESEVGLIKIFRFEISIVRGSGNQSCAVNDLLYHGSYKGCSLYD